MGAVVTVSEKSEGYTAAFKLAGGEPVEGSSMTFTFEGATSLVVTNTLNGTVPSGIADTAARSAAMAALPLGAIALALYYKRRRV